MAHLRFDPTAAPQCFSTAEGLRVRVLQLPAGSQAAALVRVHAGAHDAPIAYPGLAHFLEHLLFLGSAGYPVEDSLMAFVQGCGGQLNASTRERHTDFFFQLSAENFQGGLQRLLDMLARPLLDPAAQLREREVLQAEYLARAQDSETLCDAAHGTALDSAHPFAAFHAGNRASLPVESAAFQQALRGYHQRFYHAGALELLVAGPLEPAALLALLEAPQCRFAARAQPSPSLPPLHGTPRSARLQLANGRPRLEAAFCLDDMPCGSAAALDALASSLQAEAPGSLFALLRDHGWIDRLRLRVPYWCADQGVVVIEFGLTAEGLAARAGIIDALHSWLAFLGQEAVLTPCWDEYRRVRERSLQVMPPLARLRHWIEPEALLAHEQPDTVYQALREVVARLQSVPAILTADPRPAPPIETAGFTLHMAAEQLPTIALPSWRWTLPAGNPWLRARPLSSPTQAEPALRCVGPLDANGQGALFLHWRFDGASPGGLWHVLDRALRPAIQAAQQAGVELRFEDFGNGWCLSLFGYAAALPVIADDLLKLLSEPPASAYVDGGRQFAEAARLHGEELLIRQLIGRLPRLLGSADAAMSVPLDRAALSAAWARAHWQALAVGLAPELNDALHAVLGDTPGRPLREPADVPRPWYAGRRFWWSVGEPAAETAVLLFCPRPTRDARQEATWRALARTMESGFFRRLRSELQLGYAVFCGFRQFGEHAGILFAVQSPSTTAAQIVAHIEEFLARLSASLDSDTAQVPGDSALDDPLQRAERIWQACLAGQAIDHPAQVAAAMHELRPEALRAALAALRNAQGGWCCLANAAAPDARWQAR
ncbi:pyrroloquinoline quinone biosynthesis protein PqqF [Stutzerimonas degradans]|uniref:pyrroloquinoline quinone biosynthesis protein PqqF n=1 Tax=Stutzerimonas degradans TaxID=2968968 RepID=UPI0013F4DC6F|nr:pyrroloquinoline quinone biosynthesis protein PqqF [Stutzerimonas degradans]NHC10296.1 pyrroloquinoline quinone biosynthesis protein PqqF [Stutzerimonas degradans]